MGRSYGKIEIESIEEEAVQMFFEFLQGTNCPEKLTPKNQPHLTAEEAFSVIYYLQEVMEILPDKYEMCRKCGCIYDTYAGGTVITEDTTIISEGGEEVPGNFPEEMHGTYCEDCRPD